MVKRFFPIALFALAGHAMAQFYTTVETYAGSGITGLLDGPLTVARFNKPYSVCHDMATGDIYVADAYNHAIRKISGGYVTTLAGNGTSGDVDAQGTSARFYVPTGIDFYDGYVYVTDNGNHKIKRIDALGYVETIAGTGSAGTTDGPALSAKFFNPTEVRVRPDGVIFVSDYGNHTIRKIDGGVVSTFAGLGGYAGDVLGTGSSARFNRPTGIAFGSSGYLFVADQVNCKIKAISTTGVVTLIAGSGATASVDGIGTTASFCRPTYVGWDPLGALMVAEWMCNDIRRVQSDGTVTTIAGTGVSGYADGPIATATFDSPYGVCVDILGNGYIGDKENDVIRKLNKLGGGVGISERQVLEDAYLFPNPSGDIVHVVFGQRTKGMIRMEVVNAIGEVVLTRSADYVPGEVVDVDLFDLAAGRYCINLISEDGQRQSMVFTRSL